MLKYPHIKLFINNNEEAADCDYLPCHSTATSSLTDVSKDAHGVFEDLAKGRRCNPKSLMCGYLNLKAYHIPLKVGLYISYVANIGIPHIE
jgi:hypothetical protein